jgi:hypothetical protein
MRSPDSFRHWRIIPTVLVLILALPLPSAHKVQMHEPDQRSGDPRRPARSPATSPPVSEHAERGGLDDTEAQRESFLQQTRLADLRREYAMYSPADDVIRLLADGDFATAVALLVERANANDLPAATMLLTLSLQCGQPQESLVESTSWDWYVRRAKELGRSEEVLNRISWLREDEIGREHHRQEAACSISDDEVSAAALVLLGGLGATRQEFAEPMSIRSLDSLLMKRYRTLGAQNPFLEYAAATWLLKGTDAAERTEGWALLQNAALTLPIAKTALAMCYIDDCTRSGAVPDSSATMALLQEAGYAGDIGAIRFLALGVDALGGDIPEPRVGDASPSDWADVRDSLMLAGVLGQAAYLEQALSTRTSYVADGVSTEASKPRSATPSRLTQEIYEILR